MKNLSGLICIALVFGASQLFSQEIVGKWHGVNCSGIEVKDDKTMLISHLEQPFKYRVTKKQLIINSERDNSFYGFIEDYRYEILVLNEDSLIINPKVSEYNLFINQLDSRLFFVRIKE